MSDKLIVPSPRSRGTWIQTDRAAHEAWAQLAKRPASSAVMHMLCAHVGEHNAVVVSQKTLAKQCGLTVRSVQRAISDLVAGQWIEVRQVGATGSVNAYVVNSRVAWHGARDGQRYALFSAQVIVSADEQPDRDELGEQAPLKMLPRLDEMQLPSGDGLPPPSEPSLPTMEPDLPSTGSQPIVPAPDASSRNDDRGAIDRWREVRELLDLIEQESDRIHDYRRKKQDDADAPPMIDNAPIESEAAEVDSEPPLLTHEPQKSDALEWWHSLTDRTRDHFSRKIGLRYVKDWLAGGTEIVTRRERDFAELAYEQHLKHGVKLPANIKRVGRAPPGEQ